MAAVHFGDGRRLHMTVRLGPNLEVLRYTFDLVGPRGRMWGRHGHQEQAGFHHRHDPPDFVAARSEASTTFLDIETLLHGQ